jgi:hypothetical protein
LNPPLKCCRPIDAIDIDIHRSSTPHNPAWDNQKGFHAGANKWQASMTGVCEVIEDRDAKFSHPSQVRTPR